MLDQYYTPQQRHQIDQRAQQLGDAAIRAAEAQWSALIEKVRAEMAAGTDPSDPRVQSFADRWRKLVGQFTGGDPGIARSVGRMWNEEANIHGLDTAEIGRMMEYLSRSG